MVDSWKSMVDSIYEVNSWKSTIDSKVPCKLLSLLLSRFFSSTVRANAIGEVLGACLSSSLCLTVFFFALFFLFLTLGLSRRIILFEFFFPILLAWFLSCFVRFLNLVI